MSFPFDTNDMAFPGFDSILETVQNQFWWGRNEQQTFLPATISGAARDAGNTVTDVLRGGLLLGKVTATGLYKEWNPTGTDGSEVISGVLMAPLKMTDAGSNADRYGFVWVGGNAYSDRLLVPGEADEGIVGHAQEWNVVNQLGAIGCRLDKHIKYGGGPYTYRPRTMSAAQLTASAITVVDTDHGTTFILSDTDATAVTLPEPEIGLTFHFVNIANANATLDMATGKFVTPGAITTDTIVLAIGESATLIGITSALYMAHITEAATD